MILSDEADTARLVQMSSTAERPNEATLETGHPLACSLAGDPGLDGSLDIQMYVL